jgi:hypothetical protein
MIDRMDKSPAMGGRQAGGGAPTVDNDDRESGAENSYGGNGKPTPMHQWKRGSEGSSLFSMATGVRQKFYGVYTQ